MLDWVILICHKDVLQSSDLQFGFKENSSTSHCTFVAMETINYYNFNNTNVNAILLDASKAFDRVQYVKLFRLLLHKGLCPLLVRLLIFIYTNQEVCTKWRAQISHPFRVSNGIKQGGVLSPVLFCVYFDELLDRLKSSGYGCYIGKTYSGALAYADDIVLLAPTRLSIEKMLKICALYAKEYDVLFNPEKSKHMVFGRNVENKNVIVMDGRTIDTVSSDVHLGHNIGVNMIEKQIDKAIGEINWRTNMLMSQFKQAYTYTRYSLFNAYCMSLYGAPLWDLCSNSIERLYTAWRKCVRKVMNVPYKTHSELLPLITCDVSIKTKIYRRSLKFLHSVVNSKCKCLAMCGKLVQNGSTSTVGTNFNFLCYKYRIAKTDFHNFTRYSLSKWMISFNDEKPQHYGERVSTIIDLLLMRDNPGSNILSSEEICYLLNFLCES